MGFAPYRPYPFFRRLAPWPLFWLGCWSAEYTPSLDTHMSIPHLVKCGQNLVMGTLTQTSLRVTPAMAAGVTDHLWDGSELVSLAEATERREKAQ